MNSRSIKLASSAVILLVLGLGYYLWGASLPGTDPVVQGQAELASSNQRLSSSLAGPAQRISLADTPPFGETAADDRRAQPQGRICFLDAATASPLARSHWVLTSLPSDKHTYDADEFGVIQVPPGEWRIEDWRGTYAGVSADRVVVCPKDCAVVWVAIRLAVRVTVVEEGGAPIEKASVEWGANSGILERGGSFEDDSATRQKFTDAKGEAFFPSLPAPWIGRVLVAKQGYYPCQQTIAVTPTEGAATAQVVLRRTASDKQWGIRCIDHHGAALAQVDVYADLVMNTWPDVSLIFLGRSDASGRVTLDDWVGQSYALEFRGAIYPSRWVLGHESLKAQQFVDVDIPRSLPGHLFMPIHENGHHMTLSVVELEERADGTTYTSLRPQVVSLTVDADGRCEAALPDARVVQLSCRDESARAWSGTEAVDTAGWQLRVDLTDDSGPEVIIVPHGGRIGSVNLLSESLAHPVMVTELKHQGDAVALNLPAKLYALQVRSTDGQCVTLDRQRDTPEPVIDVYFQASGDVDLAVVDDSGAPVTDVQLLLKRRATPERVRSIGGCWAQSAASGFRLQPDARGLVHTHLPTGEYEIRLTHLPWRESLAFEFSPVAPPTLVISEEKEPTAINVVVPRPRTIALRMRTAAGRDQPLRWTLWDSAQMHGNVFQGHYAVVWATEASLHLELRDEAGTVLGRLEVPEGKSSWNGDLTL